MFQCLLTPAAGKRLIAKAMLSHPFIQKGLEYGRVVIIAGTTNSYIAEEILRATGQDSDFSRERFFRGITLPPGKETTEEGRLHDESEFLGDVIINKGEWEKGKSVYDIIDDLNSGDVIIKGANAFNPCTKKAGILIGHPKGGTIAAVMGSVTGKRIPLLIPVGLEKRVYKDIDSIAEDLNHPDASGPRLFPVPGEVISEIEAVKLLTGADASLTAGGGVCGAEGAVWLCLTGDKCCLETAENVICQTSGEEPFSM
ncbi:MAG: hypothetical protein ACOCSE_03370 [Chitinivibrionales bacterium]